MDQSYIDNWVAGRPEVFFEGSWSQVCGFAFDGSDADVACRQLGYGPGTAVPEAAFTSSRSGSNEGPDVVPPVAIGKSGCTGSEDRLLDCPVDPKLSALVSISIRDSDRYCLTSSRPGLRIGCVAEPVSGTPLTRWLHPSE